MNHNSVKVIGAGVTEIAIPLYLKIFRWIFIFSIFILLSLLPIFVTGIDFIISEIKIFPAICFSLWITFVFIVVYKLRSFLSLRLFKIKDASKSYLGFSSNLHKTFSLITTFSLFLLVLNLPRYFILSLNVPEKLNFINFSQAAIKNENTLPIYFWDYSTFLPLDWIKSMDLVLPYEKGPPIKYLAKVYFRNIKTGALELELHGKRPRSFDYQELYRLFDTITKSPLERWKPRSVFLLHWIQSEAGITAANTSNKELYLMNYENGTHLFGIPWTEHGGGRFFYLGPDGGIYQVRCHEPCLANDFFSFVKFPDDPKGSFNQRAEFTAVQIRKFIKKLNETPKTDTTTRLELESILKVYLVSYITLDPRASEAFFHLGKLSRSKDALSSILKYAKDIKMDPANIAELELQFSTLTN